MNHRSIRANRLRRITQLPRTMADDPTQSASALRHSRMPWNRHFELAQPSAASLTEASGNPCGDLQAAHLIASRHGSRARARAAPRHGRRPRPFQPSLAATSSQPRRNGGGLLRGCARVSAGSTALAGTIGTPPTARSRATPQAQADRTRVRASGHPRRPPAGHRQAPHRSHPEPNRRRKPNAPVSSSVGWLAPVCLEGLASSPVYVRWCAPRWCLASRGGLRQANLSASLLDVINNVDY
jgi:hypothetical protein